MAFLIKKQSFQKLTVILRVTGKLLLKSKDMCLNEIFELTILMLTFCKNVFPKDISRHVKNNKNNTSSSELLTLSEQFQNPFGSSKTHNQSRDTPNTHDRSLSWICIEKPIRYHITI